ncbi:MAG: SDR family oxidoreductase [Clostridia bacterium]|nr:SDR family oxidoreductase [Clostridia bacterium]
MKDKVILITGGSSGMGLETARKLKARGMRVIIAARNKDALARAQAETGADFALPMDVTSYGDWLNAKALIEEKFGRLDILLNNAGGGVAIKPFLEQDKAQIDAAVALNLSGAMYGCRVLAPMLKEQKSGLIINVLSVCATHAWGSWSVYSAAKAGLRMFSRCLYEELQPYNVKVTNFIPAAANTNFNPAAGLEANNALLTGADVADAIEAICSMKEHVYVEEMTVWGIDQEVSPL